MMTQAKPHFFPCRSELHQVCVGSVGVELQHLSVPVRPVFHRHGSSRHFLLTQRNEGAVEPQAVLFVDVVVVLHASAFGLPAQRGLRDDQQAAGKIQHRNHLPRVGLTQPHVQQCGRWTREGRTQYLHLMRDLKQEEFRYGGQRLKMSLTHLGQDVVCGSFKEADVDHHPSVDLNTQAQTSHVMWTTQQPVSLLQL